MSEPPRQAVILAGGRGERLRPLTDTRPKPMIEFHGRPFLEYIVELLREQGIERVTMLLGWLPEVVQDHFGDGAGFGVEIDYSVTPAEYLTARRVQVAEPLLDDAFLLLYCDNFWPLRLERMWQRFSSAAAPVMVTTYRNNDGWSRSGVRVDPEGWIRAYDRSRCAAGLNGVEISYALVRKEVLGLLPADGDAQFEHAVYPQLIDRGELLAWPTDHRYYSVSDHSRLDATERFLARRPAVLLDRDGVLNRRPPRASYVRGPEELEWLPGAREALRLFHDHGFTTIVVTNQPGIARGEMTARDLTRVHERLCADALDAGGRIDAIFHCPHGWDEGCECRKPRPGMLFAAQRRFDLDLSRVTFVGDDERDEEAADAAGCRFEYASEAAPLIDVARGLVASAGERSVVGAA